ncbi:hypothetical protein EV379_2288 [Microterricola gilva]|uniref:Uncharacterized protein n=1 Tax=Microterricola gilva TaxID=393267 RepID=A0A4Q8APJ9_9MICO|nr:hypothetical protein EV379_2288 [Microterricola gilva]
MAARRPRAAASGDASAAVSSESSSSSAERVSGARKAMAGSGGCRANDSAPSLVARETPTPGRECRNCAVSAATCAKTALSAGCGCRGGRQRRRAQGFASGAARSSRRRSLEPACRGAYSRPRHASTGDGGTDAGAAVSGDALGASSQRAERRTADRGTPRQATVARMPGRPSAQMRSGLRERRCSFLAAPFARASVQRAAGASDWRTPRRQKQERDAHTTAAEGAPATEALTRSTDSVPRLSGRSGSDSTQRCAFERRRTSIGGGSCGCQSWGCRLACRWRGKPFAA